MVHPERGRDVELPRLPLGPGRSGLSKQARLVLGLTLALVVTLAVGVGAVLLTRPPAVPGRAVTIPAADRSASPALLRAAEAVGFHPNSTPGMGLVESQPIAAAQPPSAPGLLPVGSQAPGFTLRTPTGAPVRLAALRGKAVLLEFFATWCPHCAAEAPHLESLYRSLPRSKVAFVAVDADGEDAASVLAYHIYFGFGFPALLDPSSHPGTFHSPGSPGRVSTAYRVAVYPTFYVLDRRGRVVWCSDGEQPDLLLRRELLRASRP